jgi:gas vesicle protein
VNHATHSKNSVTPSIVAVPTFTSFNNLNKIKRMKSGKILLGLLAGVAAGALLGILFAPDKGAKTRKRILAKGEGYAEELKEKFNEFAESLKEQRDEVMAEVEETVKEKVSKNGASK